MHDVACGQSPTPQQNLSQSQYHLSSYRSSSVFVTAATTTITKNTTFLPEQKPMIEVVPSKYRQALIAQFWSTMRSIIQTDLLIKHIETYSPNSGHLFEQVINNQIKPQNENNENEQLTNSDNQQKSENQLTQNYDQQVSKDETQYAQKNKIQESQKLENQQTDEANFSLNNLSTNNSNTDSNTTSNNNKADKSILTNSALRNGMPLFYLSLATSNESFPYTRNVPKLR